VSRSFRRGGRLSRRAVTGGGSGTRLEWRARLHRITAAATLLLWGAGDLVNPVAYGEAWQQRVKGAVLSVAPGGHMLLHEAPEPSEAVVTTFLGGG